MSPTRYIPLVLACICIALWFVMNVCLSAACPIGAAVGTSFLLPLALYSGCALLPAVLILFGPSHAFRIWSWFAIIWTLLSFLMIANTPAVSNGFFTTLPWTRGLTALATGTTFALASTALILALSNRTPKKP